VQLVPPEVLPSVPIQSELNRKNLPSCDTWLMPFLVVNVCDFEVTKLCANRATTPVEACRLPACLSVFGESSAAGSGLWLAHRTSHRC
jgi:hypothetical protein